jgi:tungstate transport system substrate-binding protein
VPPVEERRFGSLRRVSHFPTGICDFFCPHNINKKWTVNSLMFQGKSLFIKISFALLISTSIFFVFSCTEQAAPLEEQVLESEEEEETSPVEIIDRIILATTTSTYDSGLLDFLNPNFTEQMGIEVQVVSQGTGAALETGARGDADVLLVHDRDSELALVEEDALVNRFDVMYNDFIIVGPAEDPAGLLSVSSVVDAFNLIADSELVFVSRGDDSGTHRMELRLWNNAGIDPSGQGWYQSVGQGMGDTLNMANEQLGYAMTDRGTYVSMMDNLDLIIVLEGDPALFNQYGVMAVNPAVHPAVKYDYALMYVEFLMSEKGQALIEAYQVNGETLFFAGYGLE